MPDSTSGKKRILVIEDNSETQLILKIYLRDLYDVNLVQNADDGLKEIRNGNYDLLVLDINLPGKLDGNDVIKEVRKDDKIKNLPILVITAYALQGDREKYLSLGANEYLSKPVEKKDVLRLVEDLLK